MSIAAPTTAPAETTGFRRPTSDDIHRFASIRDYPCVSLLLTTRPQPRMAPDDRARLDALVREARQRLQAEGKSDAIGAALEVTVTALQEVPTDHGLAIYATPNLIEYRHLPIEVADRVVVDPTLATRDLVHAVQANPDYLLVVVDGDVARLYRSRTGTLSEVVDDAFPVTRELDLTDPGSRPGRRRGSRPGRRDARHREQIRAFLRRVDRLVADELEEAPRPVVVMAGDRLLSDYLSVTRLSGRIIALARSGGGRPHPRRLERMVRPMMAEHLADLEAAAQDTLEARLPGREVVTGLAASWHAAVSERPELLLVEQSYAMPARVSEDGSLLAPTGWEERELPEVLDDAVDELVEVVLGRGGQVRFVPDGSLQHADRVALSVLLPRHRHRRA